MRHEKALTVCRDIFFYSAMHLGECTRNSPKPRKIFFRHGHRYFEPALLEKHDKHGGAQVKRSVLPYLTLTRLPLSKQSRTGGRQQCARIYTALHSSERLEHIYFVLIRTTSINASLSRSLSRIVNVFTSHCNLPILRLIRMERRTSGKKIGRLIIRWYSILQTTGVSLRNGFIWLRMGSSSE
jgi:hypothetical protein